MNCLTEVCVFDPDHTCNVLVHLHNEFDGDAHLSLIYNEMLPKYCVNCSHNKKLME